MTGGTHLSATASEGKERRGPARKEGLLLGRCWAEGSGDADEAGKSEGLQRTSAVGPR